MSSILTACNGMIEDAVREWLADYSELSPVEVHSFASSVEHNQAVVTALYTVLEERNKYQEVCSCMPRCP